MVKRKSSRKIKMEKGEGGWEGEGGNGKLLGGEMMSGLMERGVREEEKGGGREVERKLGEVGREVREEGKGSAGEEK